MDAGPSRKRLRRGTRSCYQCRKRKVKCQLTDENVETCAECVKSGTQCTLQPPDTTLGRGASPVNVDKQEHESRLERIETLLKKLVEAQATQPVEGSLKSMPTAPVSPWGDHLLPSKSNATPPLVDDHEFATVQPLDTQDPKQSLVSLLPSAQDAVTIVANTTAWLWAAESPPGSVLNPNDTVRLLEIAAISRGSAMDIAKSLLLFALYMQQLPPNFNTQFLESQSVDKAIEVIVERVKLFILSHDDEACSLDGLECLTLLSLLELNDGSIRKAWMTTRRVLDIARLKGLHNSFSISARNSTCSDMGLRRRLWLSTVCSDCYCSLLLGLEPGLGIAPFGPDDTIWNDPLADEHANVQRRLSLIVARIAQRNAVGLHQDHQVLREIDEALNRLQGSVSPSWWRVPSFRQDRPLESAREPNRLICQLWFFQAQIFAHMPLAFGTTTNDSFSSLETCMEASRVTLQRYLGLQHAKDHLSRCRTVDQSAFVAAVVLVLAKAQLQCHKQHSTTSRYDSDRALLEQVIDSFESVGKMCRREHVARQSYEILSTMLDIAATGSNVLLTSNSSSDPDTPVEPGTLFGPEVTVESVLDAAKSGLEEIIASSILPMLDAQSPASDVINLLFATRRSGSGVPKHNQDQFPPGHTELTFDDLIDPKILQ
ncbi:hypothetical protein B0T10DRAFT_296001 [Thelonectria olida]|uniref:Zn(2)-C6 fungal-type domain-containing protein n=1 Tax=Thelonectria olida TaxID=1576542 RepID=A0A9P8VQ21_9HYPO|nr:hypothetical protein B0T10DRAFT_296001 [Thelonectria olida]